VGKNAIEGILKGGKEIIILEEERPKVILESWSLEGEGKEWHNLLVGEGKAFLAYFGRDGGPFKRNINCSLIDEMIL
jgi:hypothetical protein